MRTTAPVRKPRAAPPPIDRRRSLDGIPVLNDGVSTRQRGDGNMDIVIRSARGRGFLARFMPPVLEKRFKLDELGSFVLAEIDGRHSVIEIVNAFVARYRTNRREAELSTVAFLRSLAERKLISIVIR